MIYPDYAFGYDHRDYFSAGDAGAGRRGRRADRDPADRDLLHPLLAADPGRDRGALPRHGRAGRAHLRQGARRVLRLGRAPQIFGFIDSLEAVDIDEPRPRVPRRHAISGKARRATSSRTPASTRTSTAPPSASTTTAPRSATPRRSRPTRTCSSAGRRSSSSSGDGGRRLQGAGRPARLVEATEAMTDVRRWQRASAGRQDLQRQDPPGLRPPEHLQGRGRQAQGGAPHRDRGRALRRRGATTPRSRSEPGGLGSSARSSCSPPSRAWSWRRCWR